MLEILKATGNERMEKGKALYVPCDMSSAHQYRRDEILTAFAVTDANAGHDYGTIEKPNDVITSSVILMGETALDNPRW